MKWIISIGIDNYTDNKLAKLNNAVDDCMAMAAFFKPHAQEILVNATKKQILDVIKETNTKEDDLLVFFYAGHGVMLHDQPYLVPRDGELGKSQTLLCLKDLFKVIRKLQLAKHIVVFLDCCHSGYASAIPRNM